MFYAHQTHLVCLAMSNRRLRILESIARSAPPAFQEALLPTANQHMHNGRGDNNTMFVNRLTPDKSRTHAA